MPNFRFRAFAALVITSVAGCSTQTGSDRPQTPSASGKVTVSVPVHHDLSAPLYLMPAVSWTEGIDHPPLPVPRRPRAPRPDPLATSQTTASGPTGALVKM